MNAIDRIQVTSSKTCRKASVEFYHQGRDWRCEASTEFVSFTTTRPYRTAHITKYDTGSKMSGLIIDRDTAPPKVVAVLEACVAKTTMNEHEIAAAKEILSSAVEVFRKEFYGE